MNRPFPNRLYMNRKLFATHFILNYTPSCSRPRKIMQTGDTTRKTDSPDRYFRIEKKPRQPRPIIRRLG